MNNFPLTILTPMGVSYQGDVSEAYFPSTNGPIGILFGHTPLMAPLSQKPAILWLTDSSGNKKYFVIEGGALEVKKEKSFVLTEKCECVSSMEQAHEKLLQKAQNQQKDLNKDVKLAEANLTSSYRNSH